MKVAYYKAVSPRSPRRRSWTPLPRRSRRLGIELEELSGHLLRCRRHSRAEPDYYLHLNARILAYAEATGCDTLMTICNVCTLNLRQASAASRTTIRCRCARNENLEKVGAPAYSGGVDVKHLLWLIAEVTATTS